MLGTADWLTESSAGMDGEFQEENRRVEELEARMEQWFWER